MSENIIVLGAGIAGISACYHAQQKGYDVTCYEAENEMGGLVANFSINGFRFDKAIHLSFTDDKYVRSFFDKITYISHKPDSYCLDKRVWLKHPIQNNLYSLPLSEKVTHIKSFIDRPSKEPVNYAEWLEHQYGESIANTYPKKYTEKYWGVNANKLSMSWIGNRMRRANIDEILQGALEERKDNHYYAKEMRYPKKGGYFEFVREIAEQCNIECNKLATQISLDDKLVTFSDGSSIQYSNLISSLPLPKLCSIIESCPAEVLEAANSLLWTSVDLISVGFNKEHVPPYLWFYIYDEENLAARAYSPSWKSSDNAPKGCSSLQFEVYNLSTSNRLCPDKLVENIKTNLLEMNICTEKEIEFLHHKHLPFGNVVFDHNMEERRQVVLDYLDSVNIKTCGRFGEWDYFWSDQSFMSGKNAV